MNTNPTESNECGRDCFGCNQEGENRNLWRKSNVLYNWECYVKDVCPDTGYDGQTSKNNFTRSSQHTSLYESWARYQNKVINPKTKKPYSKPQSHSFLFDHLQEDHNGYPPNFTLQSKRYYGKDRLACQVAEGVSLKMRKVKFLNSKADWDAKLMWSLRSRTPSILLELTTLTACRWNSKTHAKDKISKPFV